MDNFCEFYNEHKDRLFGYLLRKSGNYHLASDIMQESFTRYLEKYRDREYSSSLLFAIGRNLLYDYGRKRRLETVYDETLHPSADNQTDDFLIKEKSKLLLDAIKELKEDERDILSLVLSSGLSYREIAEIVGYSETNIKVKVHRARLKLKNIVQRKGL